MDTFELSENQSIFTFDVMSDGKKSWLTIPAKILDGSFLKLNIKEIFPVPAHQKMKKDYQEHFDKMCSLMEDPKNWNEIYGKKVNVDVSNDKNSKKLFDSLTRSLEILEDKEKEYSKNYNLSSYFFDCQQNGELINTEKAYPEDVDVINALNAYLTDKDSQTDEELQAIFKSSDMRTAYYGKATEWISHWVKSLKKSI